MADVVHLRLETLRGVDPELATKVDPHFEIQKKVAMSRIGAKTVVVGAGFLHPGQGWVMSDIVVSEEHEKTIPGIR